MRLPSRVAKIHPSENLAITVKGNALRAQGRDVIGFTAGEPYLIHPFKDGAIKAIENCFTKYTPSKLE